MDDPISFWGKGRLRCDPPWADIAAGSASRSNGSGRTLFAVTVSTVFLSPSPSLPLLRLGPRGGKRPGRLASSPPAPRPPPPLRPFPDAHPPQDCGLVSRITSQVAYRIAVAAVPKRRPGLAPR